MSRPSTDDQAARPDREHLGLGTHVDQHPRRVAGVQRDDPPRRVSRATTAAYGVSAAWRPVVDRPPPGGAAAAERSAR